MYEILKTKSSSNYASGEKSLDLGYMALLFMVLFCRYDLTQFEGVSVMNLTFGDIKEAVVDKFCVEECADFYQDEFLGCCTASMVQDEGRD